MTDKRELILAALESTLTGVPNIIVVKRNDQNVAPSEMPAIVIMDADEEAVDQSYPGGRPTTAPRVIRMAPEVYVVNKAVPDGIGGVVNDFIDQMYRRVMNSVSLRALVLDRNGIRYDGSQTALGLGRQVQAECAIDFSFFYVRDASPVEGATTTEPAFATTTEPPVVATTTEPPVVATTTEPPVPVTTTEPPVVATTTEPPVVATTTEPPVPVTTTEPPVPVTTTEPPVPVTTTEPSVPVTTTEPPVPVTTTEPGLVMPSLRAAGTPTGLTTAITVAVPAGTLGGDFLLLHVETNGSTISTPAGWNLVATALGNNGSVSTRSYLFWRYAPGTTGAATTLTSQAVADSGDHTLGRMFAFKDVNPTTPYDWVIKYEPTGSVNTITYSSNADVAYAGELGVFTGSFSQSTSNLFTILSANDFGAVIDTYHYVSTQGDDGALGLVTAAAPGVGTGKVPPTMQFQATGGGTVSGGTSGIALGLRPV